MKILDGFRKAGLSCAPNTKVGTFKAAFKEEFGVNVRVYVKTSNVPAKDTQTLASTKVDDFKGEGSEISLKLNQTISAAEEEFKNKMGVKIQIENKAGELADNALTLGDLKRM